VLLQQQQHQQYPWRLGDKQPWETVAAEAALKRRLAESHGQPAVGLAGALSTGIEGG
jgi:hypothetical protein